MPVIKSYTAPLGGSTISGGRRATPTDMGAPARRSFGEGLGNAAESILATKENEETRSALVETAKIKASYAERLDAAERSGGDTAKLREDLNNELAAVGSTFETRKGRSALELYTANTNESFTQQINAVEVRRAAADAKLRGNEWLNATSVMLARDPTQLARAEQEASDFVDTFNVPPEQRALLKQELIQNVNMSAALASARIDPAGTKERLTNGEWTLTPAQRQQAIGKAAFAERERRSEERAAEALARQQRNDADQAALNEGVRAILRGEAPDLFDARLSGQSQENLVRFRDAMTDSLDKGIARSNPTTKRDLWLRVNADPTDPNKIVSSAPILDAVADGTLNTSDADHLITLLQNNKDGSGDTFRQRLGERMGNIVGAMRGSPEFAAQPELSAAIQNELLARAEEKVALLREKGRDPSSMLDPTSEDYFFKPGLIKVVAEDLKTQAWKDKAIDLSRPDAPNPIDLPIGTPIIRPDGTPDVMTQQLHDALVKHQEATGGRRYPIPPAEDVGG